MNSFLLLNTVMKSLPPLKHQKSEVNSLKCIVLQEYTSLKTTCIFEAHMQPAAYSKPHQTSKTEHFLETVNNF